MKMLNNYSFRLPLILAASAALLGAPVFAKDTVGGVMVNSGISEVGKAWKKALEAGDSKAMARMHIPSTVLYGADSTVTLGAEAIMTGYNALFSRYTAKVDIHEASWVRQGPLISSWGQYTLTLTPRDGGTTTKVEGRFSDTAVWNDDHWQYLVDHVSVPTN
ncbi:nuclear transport factor 2 family protein [Serratia marcescens]|nr:nuclear transport factor 2 family protein [Serratia marcescens]